ncbi:MAG: T9SS C-terminal target domain-containing protein, partial [Calditrichaeota bacterium]
PTLSAGDSYYNPMGYWNGPVWVQWQYLIFRGLLNYGYTDLARDLASRIIDQVIYQLKENHWFWELYSPDDRQAGWHKTYIWTGLVARMLIDLDSLATPMLREEVYIAKSVDLMQNYPNPFNSFTRIPFYLPKRHQVSVRIYDVNGKLIETLPEKIFGPGHHNLVWKGTNSRGDQVASGIYFYEIQWSGGKQVRKMIMLR